MHRPAARGGRLRAAAVALPAALLIVSPAPGRAQEEVPRDTVRAPADTLPADTLGVAPDTAVGELPGELVGVLADSAADSTFAVLADPLRPAPSRLPGDVVVWGRERIRRSNALHLGELLAEMLPASSLVRDGFVGGPAHVVDGGLGPTGLALRVDGRPFVPLSGAAPDLSRILLAMIDEVRVRRHAGGIEVDLTTLRRTDRRAYSRIEAASGDPDIENLRLVFTNGVGSAFTARAGFELLDAGNPATDLQGFSGGLAWLPGGGTDGVELQYDQRSFERASSSEGAGTRSRLVLGGRVGLGADVQAGAWLVRAIRELDAAPEGAARPDLRDEVVHGGAEVRAAWDRARAAAGVTLAEDPAMASREARLEAGADPLPWLSVEAGGRFGAWEDFDTSEGRVGAVGRLAAGGVDVRLHGSLASGRRGAPYLASDALDAAGAVSAEPVEFDGAEAGADVDWRTLRAGIRVFRHEVDRQVAFGTGFDDAGLVGPGAEVVGWEVRIDVPVLPMSWLVGEFDPIRIRGAYRRNRVDEDAVVLFSPSERVRGEIYFEDTFLEGDLGVRLALGLDRRDPWYAPVRGGGDPAVVDERASFDFDLGIRLLDAIIFWRYDNVDGRLQRDLPDAEFPVLRQAFGIRWAFYD